MADEKPEKVPSGGKPVPVSDEELKAAFSGPAVHSNKIYLSMIEGGVRISFMERYGSAVPPVFRSAVMLSFQDAFSLRDLIARQLAQIEGLEAGLKEAIKTAETAETAEAAAKKDDGA